MSDLIDTTEMYLRTIYELEEDGVVPMRARIAEQLGHSGPTVSQTVARMERDGLVLVGEDRQLELTDEGRALATRVMRKHRLAERLLTEVLGLELSAAHEEACRWEHVMSDRVERRVLDMLDGPWESPYGNPIPGLAELGLDSPASSPDGGQPVASLDGTGVTYVTLVRWGEMPQAVPGLLDDAVALGLLPGVRVAVAQAGEEFELTTDGGTLTIAPDIARHVFVRME